MIENSIKEQSVAISSPDDNLFLNDINPTLDNQNLQDSLHLQSLFGIPALGIKQHFKAKTFENT